MSCKRLLYSALAFVTATVLAHSKEREPARLKPARPIVISSPASPWDGFYIGPTLGWTGGRSEGRYQGTTPPKPPSPPAGPFDDSCAVTENLAEVDPGSLVGLVNYLICGFLDPIEPGAIVGYNFRLGKLITGFEADVGWIGARSPKMWVPDGTSRYDQFGVTWHGHVRGRLGYAFGDYLPYIAAGLALARFNVEHYRSDPAGTVLYTADDTRLGWTIGAGVEIANLFPKLLPGWTLRGEYLYDYFPHTRYDWVPGMRYSVLNLEIQTLRAAATYRFRVPR